MTTLARIKSVLEAGGIALLPTETVWGVAGYAHETAAVDAIYAAKGRTFDKPLAVCVRDLEQAEKLGEFGPIARTLAHTYWPGPLTLIVPARSTTTLDPRCFGQASERRTLAFRCANAHWRESLCELPLALTSANLSGGEDTTTRIQACAALPDIPALDSDQSTKGLPSTIIAVIGDQMSILRQGRLVVTGVAAS